MILDDLYQDVNEAWMASSLFFFHFICQQQTSIYCNGTISSARFSCAIEGPRCEKYTGSEVSISILCITFLHLCEQLHSSLLSDCTSRNCDVGFHDFISTPYCPNSLDLGRDILEVSSCELIYFFFFFVAPIPLVPLLNFSIFQ